MPTTDGSDPRSAAVLNDSIVSLEGVSLTPSNDTIECRCGFACETAAALEQHLASSVADHQPHARIARVKLVAQLDEGSELVPLASTAESPRGPPVRQRSLLDTLHDLAQAPAAPQPALPSTQFSDQLASSRPPHAASAACRPSKESDFAQPEMPHRFSSAEAITIGHD